jgi:hypothetical protein
MLSFGSKLNIAMNTIISWVLTRLSEKSTLAGIVTLLATAGINLGSHANMVQTAVSALAAVGLVIVNEKRPITVPVAVEDVVTAIEPVIANATAETVTAPK